MVSNVVRIKDRNDLPPLADFFYVVVEETKYSMSPLLHYKFDQSNLFLDSSGNSFDLEQRFGGGMTAATDAQYGTVAYFDGSSGAALSSMPTELEGNAPRTFSVWVKRDIVGTQYLYNASSYYAYIFDNDNFVLINYGSSWISLNASDSSAFAVGKWSHIVTTYDGTTFSGYVNGVLLNSQVVSSINTPPGAVDIGHRADNRFFVTGNLSDFRVYDYALNATEISQLFANGPNPKSLDVVSFSHLVDLDWAEVAGASEYYLTFVKDSGVEQNLATTTNLTHVATNLIPGCSYEFRIYTDQDQSTFVYSKTTVTPVVDAISASSLLQRLENDLTLLSESSLGDIDSFFGTVLATGDTVVTAFGSTTFVKNAESLVLPESSSKINILTSFNQESGVGQSISVVLPDTSTIEVFYDESADEVTVGGTNYAVGTSFILGGQKVTLKNI